MKLVEIVFLASIILTIDARSTRERDCCSRIGVGYVKKYGSSFISDLMNPMVAKNHQGQIFSHYLKTEEEMFNRPVYLSERGEDAIWYCGENWYIGNYEDREYCEGYAHAGWGNDQVCVDDIRTFDWRVWNGIEWIDDKNLAVRCA